jgi:hypothetical protein
MTDRDLDDIQLPMPPWRRPVLIVMGLSLLGLGAWLNVDHPQPDPEARVVHIRADPPREQIEPLILVDVKLAEPAAAPKLACNFDPTGRHRHRPVLLGMARGPDYHPRALAYGQRFGVGSDDEDFWGPLNRGDDAAVTPAERAIAHRPLPRAPGSGAAQTDWPTFVLEVLRLLPSLLALPLFVMAARRPKRFYSV